jgi:hypothetical protein
MMYITIDGETRVAKEDYSTCNITSVDECLGDCPAPACHVRDLRSAVVDTELVDLVELALEEHWHTAYDVGSQATIAYYE